MADSVFVANHCFRHERLEMRDGKPAHLISFRPRDGLNTPDLASGFWVARDLSAVIADSIEVTNLRRLGKVMTRVVAFRSYRRTGDGIMVAAKSVVRYEFSDAWWSLVGYRRDRGGACAPGSPDFIR